MRLPIDVATDPAVGQGEGEIVDAYRKDAVLPSRDLLYLPIQNGHHLISTLVNPHGLSPIRPDEALYEIEVAVRTGQASQHAVVPHQGQAEHGAVRRRHGHTQLVLRIPDSLRPLSYHRADGHQGWPTEDLGQESHLIGTILREFARERVQVMRLLKHRLRHSLVPAQIAHALGKRRERSVDVSVVRDWHRHSLERLYDLRRICHHALSDQARQIEVGLDPMTREELRRPLCGVLALN